MKNKKLIEQLLNSRDKKIKSTESLHKYTWDSMAMISLIGIIEKKNKKKINLEKLKKLKSIGDLDKFVSEYKL